MLRDSDGQVVLAGARQALTASHLYANLLACTWALEELLRCLGGDLTTVEQEVLLEGTSATVADWLVGRGGCVHPALLSEKVYCTLHEAVLR